MGVANEIQYLQNKGEAQFKNTTKATIYFIRQIDRIFNVINFRIFFLLSVLKPQLILKILILLKRFLIKKKIKK